MGVKHAYCVPPLNCSWVHPSILRFDIPYFIHKQYPSYYQTLCTFFQTIPFKKFSSFDSSKKINFENSIYGQTNDINAQCQYTFITRDDYPLSNKQKRLTWMHSLKTTTTSFRTNHSIVKHFWINKISSTLFANEPFFELSWCSFTCAWIWSWVFLTYLIWACPKLD
jgi:hypothetical protein